METHDKKKSKYNNKKKCYISIQTTLQNSFMFTKFNFNLWKRDPKLFYTENTTSLPHL